MISVGSRDGRKGLGLELEMEETELEEGEALGYNDREEDPDIALSYIEEKIQNVLGHFQKDFEGGVSAENLGAKFGGYGSFLPTHQRSPPWSHARSQQESHNESPRSPRRLHLEERRQSSLASSSASPSARQFDGVGRSISKNTSMKTNAYPLSRHAEESNSKCGVTMKSVNPDQKTLKVRLKVGSENLPTQKNAELYSGLGLVVSPSSSLDDSPATSEGLCGKVLNAPEESPSSILEIMTSFPRVPYLSPLPEHLICLSETSKLRVKSDSETDDKTVIENLAFVSNGSHFNRSNQKVLEHKKLKSSEKHDSLSSKPSNRKSDIDLKDIGSRSQKEKESNIDAIGYEELVSNALKLPLLMSSQNTVEDTTYCMSTPTVHATVKGETFSGVTEKERLSGESLPDIGIVEKWAGRNGSCGQLPESKKGNSFEDVADHYGSNISKGRRALGSESSDPLKQVVVQKGGPDSEEGMNPAPENSSTGGKRKQKRGMSAQRAYTPENRLSVDYSVTSKRDKSTNGSGIFSKIDSRDPQRDHGKPGDMYKDFFGDVKFEDDDDEDASNSEEVTPSRKLKDTQQVGKMRLDEHNMSNVKVNTISSEKTHGPEKNSRVTAPVAATLGNGPTSEPPTAVDPLVNEEWVYCEKCEKWRLLPLGTNPKSLPDKWICRMLTWLPGMNRCSIPEDVTTNALRALYHPAPPVPIGASGIQQDGLRNPVPASLGVETVDAKSVQVHQKVAGQAAKSSRKKKHGSTSATYSTDIDGSTHSSNSRKNLPLSGKNNKLNSGSRSPVLEASGYLQTGQTNGDIDNSFDIRKNGKVSLVNSSDKGKNLKIRSKRESDIGGSTVSKRIKTEGLRNDENWASDTGEAFPKAGRGQTTGVANNVSSDGRFKYANHKESGGDAKNDSLSVVDPEIHAPGTADGVLLLSGKSGDRKRKWKEARGSQVPTGPLSSSERRRRDSGDSVEVVYENGRQKGKKARVSEPGEKDNASSKANVGTERKRGGTKEQPRGQYVNNPLISDYSKCEVGLVQHSAAANSSSSKISGSHKNKTSTEDAKGSPVESVSSSPLRLPSRDPDKVTSTRRNLVEKDDFQDSGSLMGSLRKFSGSEDDGGNNRAGTAKKVIIFRGNNQGSDVYNNQLRENNQYAIEKHASEQCQVEQIINTQKSQNGGLQKPGKGSSSHSKDRAHVSGSEINTDKTKGIESSRGPLDHTRSSDEKPSSRRTKLDDKSGTPSRMDKLVAKKDAAEGTTKGQRQKESGGHDSQDAVKSQDKKHNVGKELDPEKSAKKHNQGEVLGSKKSHSLPPLARPQGETIANLQPDPGSQKQNASKVSVTGLDNGDASKVQNQTKKAENLNGQSNTVRQSTPNSHKVRDVEAPSPLRRNSSSNAANSALKEAKDLKHLADRLKNTGSPESNGFYFEAVLKFLHGASLLESGSSEGTKQNDIAYAMHIYKTTARLCEFCAHEYEKSKDMATAAHLSNAALAYKCMEVAYMRVVYSSHTAATRDRIELQTALQVNPPGESPSSSASDIDNLNHQVIADKGPLAKVIGSPQVSGSHIISSRTRAGFLRLIDFALEVNNSMEASRKSRIAYAAAARLGESTGQREGISCLKKALDFSFHDVEGLLRVVRLAIEAMAR